MPDKRYEFAKTHEKMESGFLKVYSADRKNAAQHFIPECKQDEPEWIVVLSRYKSSAASVRKSPLPIGDPHDWRMDNGDLGRIVKLAMLFQQSQNDFRIFPGLKGPIGSYPQIFPESAILQQDLPFQKYAGRIGATVPDTSVRMGTR